MNICIIGTGYVGLVTAACLAETGNTVYCVDIDPKVIECLNTGQIHLFEPGLEPLVQRNVASKRLYFTADLSVGLENAMFVFICVGTPSLSDGSCDLSHVRQVARQIGEQISGYKIIINKSTVPVGTADEVRRIIGEVVAQRRVQVEFDVVSNPEFLKEGDAVNDFMRPDRIVIGSDNARAIRLMENLYTPFARARDKLIVMGVRSAEITKYASNCMLATKISLMNELAGICEKVGANIMQVRTGVGSDRRIGYQFIYPGIGYGGSCFPKDVRALIKTAREAGIEPYLISAVDMVNNRQKKVLAHKIIHYFDKRGGLDGKTVAMWGLAFKPNTDDVRESAALDTIHLLKEKGVKIRAFDPAANQNAKRAIGDLSRVEFFDDQYQVMEGADALVVATDWNQFKNPDFTKVKQLLSSPIIFDGRNLYSPAYLKEEGFEYFSIGRPDD